MKLKLYIAEYLLKSFIEHEYGEQCPDYEENCHCCLVWEKFKDLFDTLKL